MINKITGKAPSYTGKIKGNSPTERVQKWKDYFATLLGSPPTIVGSYVNFSGKVREVRSIFFVRLKYV